MYPTVLKVKAYSLKLSVDTSIRREELHTISTAWYGCNIHKYLFYRTSPKILSIIAQTSTQIIWASEKKNRN